MASPVLGPVDRQKDCGRVGDIPVRNLWLLMVYASDLFEELEQAKVAVEDNPDDIPDLVAEILCRRVEHRIQRNLSHGYQPRDAVLDRIRGRVDLLQTERQQLLDRGKVACQFHELTVDTARNRYVRAALDKVSTAVRRRDLAHRCRSLATRLGRMGVSGGRDFRGAVPQDRFGRHDAADQPMVAAAQLAFTLAIPTQLRGARHLSSPSDDIAWIRKLYEKGIAGFYGVVLPAAGWSVRAGSIMNWQVQDQTSGVSSILPCMRTDIVLDHGGTGRRIVVDTKFNNVVTKGQYREKTLRSGYLYQMYAYLRSQEGSGDPLADTACGLLLHPAVEGAVNEAATIQNHEMRFATVDLAATTREIRRQLLEVLGVTEQGMGRRLTPPVVGPR